MKAFYLLLIFFLSPCGMAQQSSSVFVTESFLRNRLIEHGQLVYPEIRFRARIPGIVIFNVVVDKGGSIAKAEAISGHPLLDQSAQNYLRTLKFIPLADRQVSFMMVGRYTVLFDFAETPINGLDLPAIRYLGSDSYMVEGKTLYLSQLIKWLESIRIDETRPILRLLVKEMPKAEDLNSIRKTGIQDISIHFE